MPRQAELIARPWHKGGPIGAPCLGRQSRPRCPSTRGTPLSNPSSCPLTAPLKAAIDQFKAIASDFNQRVMKLKEESSPK